LIIKWVGIRQQMDLLAIGTEVKAKGVDGEARKIAAMKGKLLT
jgi:hypothetical protein